MNLTRQLLSVMLVGLVVFGFWRSFFYGLKHCQLNRSAYKKRKDGETVLEWFLYRRYKMEFPKGLLICYFFFLCLHPFIMIVCFLLWLLKVPESIGGTIAKIIVIFDGAWMLIFGLLFWKWGPDLAYERWIKKRRGQTKQERPSQRPFSRLCFELLWE